MKKAAPSLFPLNNIQSNYRLVSRLLGMLLVIMSVSMLLPLAVSLHYGDGAQFGLGLSAMLMLMAGLFLRNLVGAGVRYDIDVRGSIWITAVVWTAVPMAGALPYLFTSEMSSFTDAAFEAFSGFTTTGSSVLRDPDNSPQGLLVWRSTSQWVGGMGLILFVIAILQRLNEGGAHLYESEFSGTLQRRLHPRMARNVTLMWVVYSGLTLLLFVLLIVGGNDFVDSYCLALSTMSTGGFMTHASGLSGFTDYTKACVTVFMFLSGINIAVLYGFFTGKWRKISRDEELRRYVIVFAVAVMLCTVAFRVSNRVGLFACLQFSLFHVASTLSSCGFYTDEPSVWPMTVSVVTFMLIIIGASAGSTGGGIKVKRLMILARSVRNYFVRMVHPRAVLSVKVDGRVVEQEYVNRVFSFVFLYLLIIVVGAFVLTLCGLDIPNALCMAAANMSNLGPSPLLDNLGTAVSYCSLMPVAKWTLMLMMLAGRIEIFALLAVFMTAYWKK